LLSPGNGIVFYLCCEVGSLFLGKLYPLFIRPVRLRGAYLPRCCPSLSRSHGRLAIARVTWWNPTNS